jgi:hypothetical protein
MNIPFLVDAHLTKSSGLDEEVISFIESIISLSFGI